MPTQSASIPMRPALAVAALSMAAALGFVLLLWPEGDASGASPYGRWLLGGHAVPLDMPLLLIGLLLAASTYLFSSIALAGLSGSPWEGCLRRLPTAAIATGFLLAILGFVANVTIAPDPAGPSLHEAGCATGVLGVLVAAMGFLFGLANGRRGDAPSRQLDAGHPA